MSVCFFVPTTEQGAGGSLEEAGEVESGSPEAESNTTDFTNATLRQFWAKVMEDIRKVTPDDFKTQVLPLARIKKIMKLDEDVKMISAEAPVLFARAAEIFIHELTLRAWVHTEDNKRRTLQRNDIAMAVSKSDQFDFLIDIVPRHEIKPTPKPHEEPPRATSNNEQVQYYFQLAQQHQAALQSPPQQQQQQIILQPQIHTVQTASGSGGGAAGGNAQSVSVQQPVHILQQLVQPSGEMQQVPIQLTQAQLNMIRMQMQNNSGQPVIIQAQPQQQQPPPQIIQVSTQQQPQPQQQQVFLTQVGSTQDGD